MWQAISFAAACCNQVFCIQPECKPYPNTFKFPGFADLPQVQHVWRPGVHQLQHDGQEGGCEQHSFSVPRKVL